MTRLNQGLFSTTMEAEKRDPGNEVVIFEAIARQVNYRIDEASDVGKGANTTISYVHHFFEHHGLVKSLSISMPIIVRRAKTKQLLYLVPNLEDDTAAPSLCQVLVFNSWAHEVWSRSKFRHNQEILQS